MKGPVYDRAALAALVGDDPAVLAETLDLFASTARAWQHECARAQESDDRACLARLGHRLKSSARAIGATELADACAALEQSAERGVETAARQDAVHAQAVLARVLSALQDDPACQVTRSSRDSGRANK